MSKNGIMSGRQPGGVLPSDEELRRILVERIEEWPDVCEASEAVRNGLDTMRDAFDEYICAVQEDMFCFAYLCGYGDGLAASVKGGARP